jgi:L-lysine exporter family protein LysE/ArgO
MISAWLHGMVLAFALILPLGPQNSFIVSQGLIHKKIRRVLPAVVAAGLSDTLLILLAVTGVSLLLLEFPAIHTTLLIAGVGMLLYLGWQLFRQPMDVADDSITEHWNYKRQIVFCLSVSLLNPFAILDTVGVIGVSAQAYEAFEKIIFVATCIFISWLWFFMLAVFGGRLSHSNFARRWLNRIAGIIIWCAAGYLGWMWW